MSVIGLCPECIDYKDARARWPEQPTIMKGECNACGRKGEFEAFRVGYLGERDCCDCMTMSHCETHQKEEGLYPLERHSEEKP